MRVGQDLRDGCAGPGAVGVELANRIGQRQAALLGALKHERRREQLRQAIEEIRRVGLAGVPAEVLLAEPAFPEEVVFADDRHREPGNAGLRAQRVDILAEIGRKAALPATAPRGSAEER